MTKEDHNFELLKQVKYKDYRGSAGVETEEIYSVFKCKECNMLEVKHYLLDYCGNSFTRTEYIYADESIHDIPLACNSHLLMNLMK